MRSSDNTFAEQIVQNKPLTEGIETFWLSKFEFVVHSKYDSGKLRERGEALFVKNLS